MPKILRKNSREDFMDEEEKDEISPGANKNMYREEEDEEYKQAEISAA